MLMHAICDVSRSEAPLVAAELPVPEPGEGEILLRVRACGVCHTELDVLEGRTPPPSLPIIPGHEVIGEVAGRGRGAHRFDDGTRVGVGWIHHSDGTPSENLADAFRGTGRDVNGGYAEFMTVPENYAYPIPASFDDAQAAPLLCAGGVGFRALRLCALEDGEALGLTGFGGCAHLVLQLARHLYPHSPVFVFARDAGAREFALELGARWAGDTDDLPPRPLDAIIDTTPAWRPVVAALRALAPGGRLIVNAIRKESGDKSALLDVDYARDLWMEKSIKSVANVTADDIDTFLPLAEQASIAPKVETLPLSEANSALRRLKQGGLSGALVLVP